MSKTKTVLVDGSAMLYRAFFAIPGTFATKDGLPTNATYGFALMFKKLFAGRKPTFGAVVFDAPGKTFRDDAYPAYKAQRPKMANDLKRQLPWIDKVVEAHGFPLLRVEGYEADDVIGTLAKQAKAAGHEVVIVSGDKDFAQLVDDDVWMHDTIRDVQYDAELVRKKWGVPPAQIVDLLAIMGDSVDNIPGVPGVGQKGAASLLEKYGSLDGVIAAVAELKGKQRAAFDDHRDLALLSRKLATIDVNVPLSVDVTDLQIQVPTADELNAVYATLEFFSLLDGGARPTAKDYAGAFSVLVEDDAVRDFLQTANAAPLTAIYPVVDGPSAARGSLVGIAFSVEEGHAVYVPFHGPEFHASHATLEQVFTFLSGPTPKITHDAKRLMVTCRKLSVEVNGLVGDTMLESFLVDPTLLIPHRLDQIARAFLHETIPQDKSLLGSGQKIRRFDECALSDVGQHVGVLALALFRSWPKVRTRLDEEGQRQHLLDVDLPLSSVLADMERVGILVDRPILQKAEAELRTELANLEKQIHGYAKHAFNIQSTKQLSDVLFEELKLPVIKKTKSGYSTDAEVLERLADVHPIAHALLEHRRIAKLINTYTEVLQREIDGVDGRVHSTFQQAVGATGRLITTEPDLQRTPIKSKEGKNIRTAFVASPDHVVLSADWSQIELRLLAHLADDDVLVDAFRNGDDIHRRTAAQIFGVRESDVEKSQRDVGKTVNFATIYGQGATALGQSLKVPRKEAQKYIDAYFATYKGVRRWLDNTIANALETGYVTTMHGRRRYIPELRSNSFVDKLAGQRIAANTPIQGSASDICKDAMLAIDLMLRETKLRAVMVLQIHDELLFEVHKNDAAKVADEVKRIMESVAALRVPLVADVGIGASWAEAH